MAELRGAVFLDRDGTLVHDPGYLHDPADVRLLPGVADGLARLAAADWPLVLVSNQSGIARGLYGADAFHAVNRRVAELLPSPAVRFAGAYHCPHHPDFTGPCDCRKPSPKLFRQAASDLGLDLARCWFVGNRATDVEPARTLGGHGILVALTASAADLAATRAMGVPIVADFPLAASLVLAPMR